MAGTPKPTTVSTKLQRVAGLARQAPGMAFTTLAHHIDVEWLHEAYKRTRKSGAVGVDGQTAAQYAEHLGMNLRALVDRLKAGTYKAPPVRRVHIPKGDGSKTRPIGIPTFEDKVLQRGVAMVLEAVYEQDFLDCSYGFRPKRSAHQAIQALWQSLTEMKGGWVLDMDIKAFYDSLVHSHLRTFLDQRVRDGVLRRIIDKWLKAGVMEDGQWSRSEDGTPQGGVVSPILANVYLHEVLDKWFEAVVKPRMKGRAVLIRYADDAVMVFARESDARKVLDVLPKRLGRFGLALHPEKTRLVDFRRPPYPSRRQPNDRRRLGTFDLLGFTHYWGVSRRGYKVVKRKTASNRLARALKAVARWCRRFRHRPVEEQHKTLCMKLRGHYQYYGITGNWQALRNFKRLVERVWRKWLHRRSHRARMGWDRFKCLLQRYALPEPRVVHSVYRAVRP